MIHRVSVTAHVHLLFTNIFFIAVLLISLLSRFFMLTFRMFFFCYYNIVKIRSASRLPLFLTILYNRKWVFKCVHTAKSTLLKYWRHYSVLYLIVWNPHSLNSLSNWREIGKQSLIALDVVLNVFLTLNMQFNIKNMV